MNAMRIIYDKTITKGNWSGSGYSIINPVTGSGAYLISGGLSGGGLEGCEPQSSPLENILFYVLAALLLILLTSLIISSGGTLAPVLASIGSIGLAGGNIARIIVGALSLGATAAASAATCAPCEPVRLYRSVGDNELTDLRKTNEFRIFNLIVKQFWSKESYAYDFGMAFNIGYYNKPKFHIVRANVSEAIVCQLTKHENLDGIGLAYSVDYTQLPLFNADMHRAGGWNFIRTVENPNK